MNDYLDINSLMDSLVGKGNVDCMEIGVREFSDSLHIAEE